MNCMEMSGNQEDALQVCSLANDRQDKHLTLRGITQERQRLGQKLESCAVHLFINVLSDCFGQSVHCAAVQ